MIRNEKKNWIFDVHMLIDNKNDDIIKEFFRQIKRWIKTWRFRYMIIDDSAAKQREINLTFRELIDEETKVFHYFCRIHSERTLNKKLDDEKCKITKKHLYDVLYFRKIKSKCDDSLKKKMTSIFMKKR